MLYLRARGYDPQIGRFISADPFEGRQRDPRSLNRYSYAHGDPVGGTDPTGWMTLGEIGTTLGNIGNMATRAYNASEYLSMLAPASGDEDALVDRRESIWDSLMATLVNQVMGSLVADPSGAVTLLAAAARKTTDGHHTVPKYMCGHRSQTLSEIPIAVHGPLHKQLYGFNRGITFAGKAYAVLFKKKERGEKKSYVKTMAETRGGRGAIARGLQFFYTQEGYSVIGTPPIGPTLVHEGARYVRGHLNRSCK